MFDTIPKTDMLVLPTTEGDTMSRKDYESLAAVINGERACAGGNKDRLRTASNIARSMADVFKRDNSRFDRERFYAACGLDSTGGFPDV